MGGALYAGVRDAFVGRFEFLCTLLWVAME